MALCYKLKRKMKNITKRHEFIIKKLEENGKVYIDKLVEVTGVSGVTIRKDLKTLEEKGLLFITRGGASLHNPYSIDRSIYEKATINAEAKNSIGKEAVRLIKDTDSVIIGSGTTAFAITHHLHPQKPLTVITPAIKVALEMSGRPNVDLLQLGGMIRPNSSSVAGSYAEYMLDRISCGIIFLGVDGIDMNFGFSISNLTEAYINQKMIETSEVVAIVADSSKFGARGIGKICDIEQVRYVITDKGVKEEYIKELDNRGVKVIVA